jgi:hypothetical protein
MASGDSSLSIYFSLDSDILSKNVIFQIEIVGIFPSERHLTFHPVRSYIATVALEAAKSPELLKMGLNRELAAVLFGIHYFFSRFFFFHISF